MMPTIRIEDDVFQALKSMAEPFVDTPNMVIRRLIDQVQKLGQTGGNAKTAKTEDLKRVQPQLRGENTRAGVLTPQSVYEDFLLFVLAKKFGGKAQKTEATSAVIDEMTSLGLIGPDELKTVSTGETKAANTIAWGRNRLKEQGLISNLSERGFWELTPAGLAKGDVVRLPSGRQ